MTISSASSPSVSLRDEYEKEQDSQAISAALNEFLLSLPKEKRVMFVLRYFYSKPISEISRQMDMGESKIKVTLHRLREELKERLEEQELL